jgi:hypothetical protein
MLRGKLFCVLIVIALVPLSTYSEHKYDPRCDKMIISGKEISTKEFPSKWLLVGNKAITDFALHGMLRSVYRKYYRITDDKTLGMFCVAKGGTYITIATQDDGTFWAEYSVIQPKCYVCKSANNDINDIESGTGLKIGQSKIEVGTTLGYTIKEDITTLICRGYNNSQSLRLEFSNDRLISYTITVCV